VQMPEMDGFEATAAIRAREQVTGGHVPLVAITARAMRGDRERCLQAGFDGYVSKPVQFEDLFDTIDQLTAATPERPARAPSSERAPVTETLRGPAFDQKTALERTGGDPDLLHELVTVFLTELPGWMGALEGAVKGGDAAELQRVAHMVKGAVDSCGAPRAFDAALLLERMGRTRDLGGARDAFATLTREIERVRPELAAFVDRPAPRVNVEGSRV